jgi:hypothetical protein
MRAVRPEQLVGFQQLGKQRHIYAPTSTRVTSPLSILVLSFQIDQIRTFWRYHRRSMQYTDLEAANALVNVIGTSRWDTVAIAQGFVAAQSGTPEEDAARIIFRNGCQTLGQSKQLIQSMKLKGFIAQLPTRERTGAAADPVPKLFPGRITEERFVELLDELKLRNADFDYDDRRNIEHGLDDFRLIQGGSELPVNVKVASTRFEQSAQLVGLDPSDCIPIPAYKATAAVTKFPALVYAVSVDYTLVNTLILQLPKLITKEEAIVWDLIGRYQGTRVRQAEDAFVFEIVRKHWDNLKPLIQDNSFHVISARKALRILHTKPARTPGIGMRGWGTGARAEVNVHVSVKEDTTPWNHVVQRIEKYGLNDVIGAVNRKRLEEVSDPEI